MNGSFRSDEELLSEIQNGYINAFKELVEKYHSPIINFFYRLCNERNLAEDLAQEVFIKLYTHIDTFELKGRFIKYLFRIARNHWIDKLRHDAPRPKTVSMDNPLGEGETTAKEYISTDVNHPSSALEKKEMSKIITEALDKLPQEQKMVILLSEFHGLSYEEISEVMNIPLGTVKSRIHFAISKLRSILKDVQL